MRSLERNKVLGQCFNTNTRNINYEYCCFVCGTHEWILLYPSREEVCLSCATWAEDTVGSIAKKLLYRRLNAYI